MKMLEVTRVSATVWCVRRLDFLSCSYVVRRPSGAVLVDAGIDPLGADMERGLAAAGCTVAQVRAILLTHWHNDHVSGAPHLARASGGTVAYHPDARGFFLHDPPLSPWRRRWAARLPQAGTLSALRGLLESGPPEPLPAHRLVSDGDVIEGLQAVSTPGHTRGHLSWWYPEEGVLFTGDALAVASGRVSFLSRWLTEDLALARQSMERCLSFPSKALCPGHRTPLLGFGGAHRERALRRLSRARPWPIYGC